MSAAAKTAARRCGEGAGACAARIRSPVPGYDTLPTLTAARAHAQLRDLARVPCVGAGTGEDLVCPAGGRPDW